MPQTFRRAPSRRREPSPVARWLVLGQPAAPILHDGRTAHLIRYQASHNSKRYARGQRLAVKEFVPGPTACHVTLTDVHGPREEFTLGQVDYGIARELGYVRLDAFHRAWLVNHDQAWLGRTVEAGEDTPEACSARFGRRWGKSRAWLLRFRLAPARASGRMLAATGQSAGNLVVGDDNRWHYVMRANEYDEDRGYTTSVARSLPEEPPALLDHEMASVAGWSERQRALRPRPERVETLRARADRHGVDVTKAFRRLDWLLERERWVEADRQIETIERRMQPAAA